MMKPVENLPTATLQRSHLGRKLVLLFLFCIAAGAWLAYLFRQRPESPPVGMLVLMSAAMGLAAGFASRVILRRWPMWVRCVFALLALFCGQFVMGFFTYWRVGIGPLRLDPPEMDWIDLAQMLIGTIVALLSLFALWRPIIKVETPAAEPARLSASPGGWAKVKSWFRRPPRSGASKIAVAKTRRRKKSARAAVKPPLKVTPKRRRTSRSKTAIKTPSRKKTSTAGSRRRSRKPDVQFSVIEEHRCPYCLEIIDPKDPRGTVECKICHAVHHADCWAITGSCQVPHMND